MSGIPTEVSLYTELLGYLWNREPQARTDRGRDLVLAEVRVLEHDLVELPDVRGYDRLALELRHDVALLTLCSVVGVNAGPERFEDPAEARHELEDELAAAGCVI